MIHLDTSFLVDLMRETKRGADGPARRWLLANRGEALSVSPFVLCELMAGAEVQERPDQERHRVRAACSGLPVAPVDEHLSTTYASIYAVLRRRGERIASMVLLIASVALNADAGLLTADTEHFRRVPGLRIIEYRV